MIIRLILVDPRPEKGRSDLLVYQVPENSREMALLIELAEEHHIEYVTVGGTVAERESLADLKAAEAALQGKNHPFLDEDARKLRLRSVRRKIKRLEKR